MPEEMYAQLMNAFDIDLIHGYGLTEFTPVSRNIRGDVRPGTIAWYAMAWNATGSLRRGGRR